MSLVTGGVEGVNPVASDLLYPLAFREGVLDLGWALPPIINKLLLTEPPACTSHLIFPALAGGSSYPHLADGEAEVKRG